MNTVERDLSLIADGDGYKIALIELNRHREASALSEMRLKKLDS